jgi:hypothetical protein
MTCGRNAYGVAIASASFLLFLIEPMMGKRILPYFGGSSSVWAGSLLFFTGMLCVGYGYAYLLTRYAGRWQGRVHAAFALCSVVALASMQWPVLDHSLPLLAVLLTLTRWIGVPFVFLASTGPLLQRWYAHTSGEPYRLYALSNAASFAALFAYPFIVEPSFALSVSLGVWRSGVVVFALLMLWLSYAQKYSSHTDVEIAHVPRTIVLRWLGLATLPAVLLVTITTQLTQVIAPIPLLWTIPLAIYLFTFILAFSGYGDSGATSMLAIVAAAAACGLTPAANPLIGLQMLAYLALLFAGSLRCHASLYALRPPAAQLPLFYLVLSFGGFVGAVLVAFLAPIVFSDYWEFPLAMAAVALVSISMSRWCHSSPRYERMLKVIASVGVLIACTAFVAQDRLSNANMGIGQRERNFYGVTTVVRMPEATALVHGRTLHGMELLGASSTEPTTYYTPTSGIGRAVAYERATKGALRVGTIGLGTGSLAAYCRAGDSFVFYEIDARIERIARDDFGYLSGCAGVDVRIGDGRVTLSQEGSAAKRDSYDILAIDAFNSDSIPLHLLTREALNVYANSLADQASIIAFHISNRYLDLAPEVIRLAADGGFASMVIRDDGSHGTLGVPTSWVLLARDSRVFKTAAFAGSDSRPPKAADTAWTDDYASVWTAVSLPRLW